MADLTLINQFGEELKELNRDRPVVLFQYSDFERVRYFRSRSQEHRPRDEINLIEGVIEDVFGSRSALQDYQQSLSDEQMLEFTDVYIAGCARETIRDYELTEAGLSTLLSDLEQHKIHGADLYAAILHCSPRTIKGTKGIIKEIREQNSDLPMILTVDDFSDKNKVSYLKANSVVALEHDTPLYEVFQELKK
jgi:hypothetical protein